MPGPADLLAQIKSRRNGPGPGSDSDSGGGDGRAALAAALRSRQAGGGAPPPAAGGPPAASAPRRVPPKVKPPTAAIPEGEMFAYDGSPEAFVFSLAERDLAPRLVPDAHGNEGTDVLVPLAPCVYRMCDYTLAKGEPVELRRCSLKLGVLRCLRRECANLNGLLWHRLSPTGPPGPAPAGPTGLGNLRLPDLTEDGGKGREAAAAAAIGGRGGSIEEDELGKARFMELLSNCGVYQKVSELLLHRAAEVSDEVAKDASASKKGGAPERGGPNPYRVPQVRVEGLDDFLRQVEERDPSLRRARDEIEQTQTVSFYPGLGELFCPGSQLLSYPEGMEGSPLGCSCVQSWYAEELNKATNITKRRFVLVVEFIVSVGDELVFVAASDVYPEFHDPSRNVPLKDLTHRKLLPEVHPGDAQLLRRLQQRGEFYASVSTHNHYLEYHPNSFFPIIGGWGNNAVRPLSKGGRVMVDVKRGILEGHLPIRATADGMSDTVKEAIKLFQQSKRTGVAVPFRTCILPGFDESPDARRKRRGGMGRLERGDSDRSSLWQSWPMLTGFSFTARVWGKLLLGMPRLPTPAATDPRQSGSGRPTLSSPRRPSSRKLGVEVSALGGEGSCGNCGYISFQEQAFEQLVLAEDKKELIRAVARNAGGGGSSWDEDEEEEEDVGLDVVANKGGASIFLLHGPPGCGKTLTAEAIAELLRKPLYIVTAGDLGITAAEVEKTLGGVLELCQTWDALVLIDEADVFLEARSSSEIQRNALVCVMLRLLEYYSGCLFLSSNRAAGSVDAAIASRITVMLGYPPLDAAGRAKVWRNLIELVPPQPADPASGEVPDHVAGNPRRASKYRVNFADADYRDLASAYDLNGRQIKNSIVLARALARERGTPLSMHVLRRAVTAVAGEGAQIQSGAKC